MISVYGWTLDEWAKAAARHPGYPPTIQGANDLRRRCNYMPPGAMKLEGVEYPEDFDWATKFAREVNSAPFNSLKNY